MKVNDLREIIKDLDGGMDVNVPSPLDADYNEEANATVHQYPSGEPYLLVHAR